MLALPEAIVRELAVTSASRRANQWTDVRQLNWNWGEHEVDINASCWKFNHREEGEKI